MATSTFDASLVGQNTADQSKPGFFKIVADSFIAQRTARARQMTAWYLASYTDKQLAGFGWTAADIKRLRGVA